MKLTEKNLKATLLNLTTTDKPTAIKPTTWFGNPAKTAQWYTCPNCAKQSPLTLEWVGLTDEERKEIHGTTKSPYDDLIAIEQALKDKNT